ncbi:MAG: hypothetical protein M5U31_10815 [Acidimicrobiia bacterium]|nr:hypothetical protein [Acidimicrobiia bacterium]
MVDYRSEVRRAIVRPEAPIAVAVYLALRAAGWVATIDWWIFPILIVVALFVSALSSAAWQGATDPRSLWLRAAVMVGALTPALYATGWGPMLAIAYVWIRATSSATPGRWSPDRCSRVRCSVFSPGKWPSSSVRHRASSTPRPSTAWRCCRLSGSESRSST